MFIFYVFMQELTAKIWYLNAVNKDDITPTSFVLVDCIELWNEISDEWDGMRGSLPTLYRLGVGLQVG